MKKKPLGTPSPSSAQNNAELGLGVPKTTASRYYRRKILPHINNINLIQSITFRLADSLPRQILENFESELSHIAQKERKIKLRQKIEDYLDSGYGCCALKHPKMADIMQETLLKHDNEKYNLIAWCIMPNHVHVLIKPKIDLSKIVQSWKSYTGRFAIKHNAELGLGVPNQSFWMKNYWDRYVRDEKHYYAIIDYIHFNPVKAGLCENPDQWKYSSAQLLK